MKALAVSFMLAFLHASVPLLFAADVGKILWPNVLEAFQGDLVEVQVGGEELLEVNGRLGKERIYFHSSQQGVSSALLGIDVEAKPTVAKLILQATTRGGAHLQREVPLKIKARAFQRESFTVAPSFDQMTPETLAEIRREQAAFAQAFANTTAERYWSLPFVRPGASAGLGLVIRIPAHHQRCAEDTA